MRARGIVDFTDDQQRERERERDRVHPLCSARGRCVPRAVDAKIVSGKARECRRAGTRYRSTSARVTFADSRRSGSRSRPGEEDRGWREIGGHDAV